jgi:predicted RNase H-like nuclease
MRVLGVDAYRKGPRKGWIGVELDRGAFVDAYIADRLDTLLSAVNDIQVVGIDMPLGLVETGRRQADLDAHAFVRGPLCSAVFLMPPQAVWKREDNTWYDDSWEQANQRCRQLTRDELSPDGYGLSRQTWGLHVKLREANGYLATNLHEVHPEVSFAAMNGRPLSTPQDQLDGAHHSPGTPRRALH